MTASASVALLAMLGLVVGVVVRGVVWRLTTEDAPRVNCPACGERARSLILPVRVLSGACPGCGERSSPQPLVPELLCALGFGLARSTGSAELRVIALCWLAAFGLAAVLVDAVIQRLPDVLTWPCLAGVAAFSCAQAAESDSSVQFLRTAAAGAAVGAVFLLAAMTLDVGAGDAKLAASLGAALGYVSWSAVITGLAAGLCLAGLHAAAVAARRRNLAAQMPLGPPLLAGAYLVLVIAR
jgi:leader peptidase (prepilin peptidase)/N-methyltransferase